MIQHAKCKFLNPEPTVISDPCPLPESRMTSSLHSGYYAPPPTSPPEHTSTRACSHTCMLVLLVHTIPFDFSAPPSPLPFQKLPLLQFSAPSSTTCYYINLSLLDTSVCLLNGMLMTSGLMLLSSCLSARMGFSQ